MCALHAHELVRATMMSQPCFSYQEGVNSSFGNTLVPSGEEGGEIELTIIALCAWMGCLTFMGTGTKLEACFKHPKLLGNYFPPHP